MDSSALTASAPSATRSARRPNFLRMPVATNWLVSIVLGQQDAGPAAGEQVQRHIGDFQLLLTKNHSPRKLFGEPWGEEVDMIDQISHLAARAVDTPASGRGFHFLFQCPQP